MSLFLSLQPLAGMRHWALEQWNAALRAQGHRVEERALRFPDAAPEATARELAAWVGREKPAAIFTASALSFLAGDFFQAAEVRAVPTAAFWFDDPLRPVERWKAREGFLEALGLPSVHHFVWDGYWRRWLAETHRIDSHPIHLAADPVVFAPRVRPALYADHAVFIGTLAGSQHLAREAAELPPVFQKIARPIEVAIREGEFGANPFAVVDAVIAALPERLRAEVEIDADRLLYLRGLAWKWGKNEVRKRMLRAALAVAPVVLFSGNLERSHASAAETAAMIGKTAYELKFVDTAGEADLAGIYAHGAVHLQATDPQSVAGGIPFRVFQTTACGRVLLTDVKPELLECYREGTEIVCYGGVEEIGPKLRHLLDSEAERGQMEGAGRARFLAEHTWDHRIEAVSSLLRLKK